MWVENERHIEDLRVELPQIVDDVGQFPQSMRPHSILLRFLHVISQP